MSARSDAAEAARALAQRLNDDSPERTAARRQAIERELSERGAGPRAFVPPRPPRPRGEPASQARAPLQPAPYAPAVTRAASLLPGAARNGDRAAASRLLDTLPDAQVRQVAFILAVSADREPPRAGDPLLAAHAAYRWYRLRGIGRAEMPGWVAAGERQYCRKAKARAARARQLARTAGRTQEPLTEEADVA